MRGCLEIPVHSSAQPLVWGVWVAISEDSLRRILDLWDEPEADKEPPRFGWLDTWIDGYPEPRKIRCHVHLRSGNLRPRIVLEPTDYALADEQTRGITLDRVKEIAARSRHG